MNATLERLRVLALQTPLARLSRSMGAADPSSTTRRHASERMPELRAFVLDGNRLLIDAAELREWAYAKADEYHGKGESYGQFMNAGRVDGYWSLAGEIEGLQRLLAAETPAPLSHTGIDRG